MLALAAICGIAIIILGFLTGAEGIPPQQALTLGGMFLISCAFGKMWRTHGIGAATIVAVITVFSLAPAVWSLVKAFIASQPLSTEHIGQSIGLMIGLGYAFIGTRFLLAQLKATKKASQPTP